VKGVPEHVEGGDFVGEKFDDEECDAGGRLLAACLTAAVPEGAGDGRSGPAVPGRRLWRRDSSPAAEADRGQESEEFAGRDLQDVEHWVLGS